ncbi:hypothetical protein [Paenibacillus taichungensis]
MAFKFSVFKAEDIDLLTHEEKVALGHIAEAIEDTAEYVFGYQY